MCTFCGVSKSSASRIVKTVCKAITKLSNRYIKIYEDINEMEQNALDFYKISHFPLTIDSIDCTIIRLPSPGGEDAEMHRLRKDYFALNVQTISDAKLRMRNIIALWPGSLQDQTIFNSSSVKRQFDLMFFIHLYSIITIPFNSIGV